MTDVLVTAHTPTLGVGGALRTYALARALAVHGPIDLVYVVSGADEPSPEIADCVLELATPGGRIVADGMTMWTSLAPVRRRRPVIFNGHNLESSFQHELGDQGYTAPERMARYEAKIFRAADEVWMVSDADVAGARALAPEATVRLVPNVVDVEALAHAVPVVATPVAAQGPTLTAGEHYVRAEGGEAFARALAGVLRDGPRTSPARGAPSRRSATPSRPFRRWLRPAPR